jgi:streptogramin lyase
VLVVAAMSAFLLAAQPASAAPYTVGDVFAGVGNGTIKQFSPTGALKDTLDTTSGSSDDTGMCFDSTGNLYSTNFQANNMTKFDNAGNVLVHPFGSGFGSAPESCVRNATGSIYVGQANDSGDILKFSAAGAPQGSFDAATELRGTDWIDLAADQCTIYYTSEGTSVKRFNVCNNTQLSNFATGLPGPNAYALRLLPDGGALVADTDRVVRLNSSGNVTQTYLASNYDSSFLFALNLDPDGNTFWTADILTGLITRINIATGNQVTQFNANPSNEVAGLTVFGERCQSCPPPPGGPVWEAAHTDPASGCSAKVQSPYLDANQQVTAYTKVTCPQATQLTVRSRLRADNPEFTDKTVAANGCLGGSGCVRTLPQGTTYFRLSCPKSQTRRNNQKYYTDINMYAGTSPSPTSPFPQRSRPSTLSPFCAY